MGRGVFVRCTACGCREEFFLGVGTLFASLLMLQDHLPSDRREEILALYRRCGPDEAEFEDAFFVCPSCHRLSSRLKIHLKPGGVTRFVSKFSCKECGSQLIERTPLQVKKIPCSRCGAKKLKVEAAQPSR
jgi:hypothetical protein